MSKARDIASNGATLTGTQTLSNKTLTTPTINGPTITAIGQTPTIHGIYLPATHNIIFEGTTADDFETTLIVGEPTADRTVTLPDATTTLVGRETVDTLSNKTLISPEERMTVSATAATGTINFDALTQGVLYYTSNASANWTLNVRGNSGATLNSILATGDAITVSFLVTNGSTAYRHTALTIDGSAQTVLWSGGTAPAAGNASGIDAYSFTIIKTAATPTYTVLGAGPIKYA
jgi:hypothetical protein